LIVYTIGCIFLADFTKKSKFFFSWTSKALYIDDKYLHNYSIHHVSCR